MGGSGREELESASPFPCCPVVCECLVEGNPERIKRSRLTFLVDLKLYVNIGIIIL